MKYTPLLFDKANSVRLAGIIIFHQYPPVTVIRAVIARKPRILLNICIVVKTSKSVVIVKDMCNTMVRVTCARRR